MLNGIECNPQIVFYFLSNRCTSFVRYLSDELSNKYRTNDGQITDQCMRGIWGTNGDALRGL